MKLTGETVVVTGAAGFIANHLSIRLLKNGATIVGVDNFDPFYSRETKEQNIEDLKSIANEAGTNFRLIETSFEELKSDQIPNGVAGVVHLGAKAGVRPSIEDPEGYYRANVMGTLRLLEICRQKSIKDFVFASSSSVYGDDTEAPFKESARCDRPISPYAATKRAGELLCANYCHLYGFKIPALRFFTVYGPKQRPDLAIHKFSRLIREGKPLEMFGDGTTGRDYTFVEDTVDGIVRALEWTMEQEPGTYEVFNFGNSHPVLLKDMIAGVQEVIGQTEVIQKPMQPGDVQQTWADISKSKEILGYNPQTPFNEGLKKFADWFR